MRPCLSGKKKIRKELCGQGKIPGWPWQWNEIWKDSIPWHGKSTRPSPSLVILESIYKERSQETTENRAYSWSTKAKLQLKIADPWGCPPTGKWRQKSQTTGSKNPPQVGELVKDMSGFRVLASVPQKPAPESKVPAIRLGALMVCVACRQVCDTLTAHWPPAAPEILHMLCF